MPRDILKTLKDEHDQLRKLFKEMESTTDRGVKTRNELLRKIDRTPSGRRACSTRASPSAPTATG